MKVWKRYYRTEEQFLEVEAETVDEACAADGPVVDRNTDCWELDELQGWIVPCPACGDLNDYEDDACGQCRVSLPKLRDEGEEVSG